jgi:hypothetical protein
VFKVEGISAIPGIAENKPCTVKHVLDSFEYLDTLNKNVESSRITDSAQLVEVEGIQFETGGDPESE